MANTNWENLPSTNTPINATNLNKTSAGIVNIGTSVDSSYNTNLIHSDNLLPKMGTQTKAGLTATEQSDGSLILNGTPTGANFSYYYCGDDTNYYNFAGLEEGGTFTLSCTQATGYYFYIMSGGNIIASLTNGGSTTFTTQAGQTYRIFVRVSLGTTLNNLHIYPMLNKGSETLDYEPFVPNSIYVNDTKFTETIGIGIDVNSANRVNVLHSKNLLDLQYLQLITNPSGTVISNNAYWDVIVDTRNINSLYVSGNFSLLADGSIRVGTYSSYPVLGSTGTRLTLQVNGTIDTSNVNYVLLAFGVSSSSVTWDQVKASFMINEGKTAY